MAGSRPLHLSVGKLIALGACLEAVRSPLRVDAILKLLKGHRFFFNMLHFFFTILDLLLYWLLARDQSSIFRFTWDRNSGTTFSYFDSMAMIKRKLNLGAIVLLVGILNRLGGIIYVQEHNLQNLASLCRNRGFPLKARLVSPIASTVSRLSVGTKGGITILDEVYCHIDV